MAAYTLDAKVLLGMGLLRSRDGRVVPIRSLSDDFVAAPLCIDYGDELDLHAPELTIERLSVILLTGRIKRVPECLTVLGHMGLYGGPVKDLEPPRVLRVGGRLEVPVRLFMVLVQAVRAGRMDLTVGGDLFIQGPPYWFCHDEGLGLMAPIPHPFEAQSRLHLYLRAISPFVGGSIRIGRNLGTYLRYDPRARGWTCP